MPIPMTSSQPQKTEPLVIWRVRSLSCDGGHIGKEWAAWFFQEKTAAESRLRQRIDSSNQRNPKYPFNEKPVAIDGVVGFCNWQFGLMLTMDGVEVE